MNRRERRGRRGRGKRERLQEWRINIQETGFLTLKAAMQYFHKNPVSEFDRTFAADLHPTAQMQSQGGLRASPASWRDEKQCGIGRSYTGVHGIARSNC